MIAEVEEQLQQQDRDPGNATLRINQVLHWGIGEVGMKDVNMAKAGDGKQLQYDIVSVAMAIYSFQCCLCPTHPSKLLICITYPMNVVYIALIIAYNVGIERSAARQALVSRIYSSI